MTDASLAKILVVDDRTDNLVVMEAVLKDAGYQLTCVTSGPEALAMIEKEDFALILLDIQMPGMDGYETAAQIKASERGKDIPIIMVTAIYTEDPHVLKGYKVGAVDYVGKPFNPDILRAKVNIYANLHAQAKQILRQNEYLLEVEKLLSEVTQSRTVLNVLPVGIIVTDRHGQITQMNSEAKAIWGGERLVGISNYQEFVGRWAKDQKLIKPHDWALARAIEKGERSEFEIIDIEAFDGARRTILHSAAPLRGPDGTVTGAVAVMENITNQKDIAAKLAAQRKQ